MIRLLTAPIRLILWLVIAPVRLVLGLLKVVLKMVWLVPKTAIKLPVGAFKTVRAVGFAGLLAFGAGIGLGFFLGSRKGSPSY